MTAQHSSSPRDAAAVDEAAAEWFARFRSGAMTTQDRQALTAWLAEAEQHRRAYARVSRVWAELEPAHGDPGVLAMREQARRTALRRRTLRWATGLAAAAVLAGVVGLPALQWWQRDASLPATAVPTITLATDVGRIVTHVIADGSTITLDTASAVEVRLAGDQRRVTLLRGRALFQVAHDSQRPFVVTAAGRTVTALGTRFDVYLRPDQLQVSLVEGRVRVQQQAAEGPAATARPAMVTELQAGQRLNAGNSDWQVQRIDAAGSLGWKDGRLTFDEAPLEEIVAELNRYATTQIRIVDPAVAQRRMSAVLRSDDTTTFLALVEALHLGRVQRGADGYLIALR